MKIPKLDVFQDMTKEILEDDQVRDDYIKKFKTVLSLDWELPEELDALPWMRKMVSSSPVDGVDAAIRSLSTIMPTLAIYPNNTSMGERKRVESIEDALMWHFRKANQRGSRRPLELIADSVLKYGGCGGRVRYLPFDFKASANTNRTKAILRQGDFAYYIYDFETVHARTSPIGLESVVVSTVMSVADLQREYPNDENVAKVVKRVTDPKKLSTLEDFFVTLYDFCDYDFRVRWVSMTDDTIVDRMAGSGDSVELLREEHKLGFLPFVYKESKGALLKSLVDSNAWEDQNVLKSLRYALLVATVAQSRTATFTYDGKPAKASYKDPGQPMAMRSGEEVRVLPPPQTDPNLDRQVQEGEQAITQQLNTRALQAAEDIASSAPFATFNAIMQTAMSSLANQTATINSFLEELFYQELCWIDYSGIPSVGRRMRNRTTWESNPEARMGATVAIGSGSGVVNFSPDHLDIRVKVRADTPTDRQSRVNEAIMLHDRMGMAWDDALEAAGLDDIERDEQALLEEQLTMATIKSETMKIEGAAQLEIQQAGMQMQQQMQQQAQQQAQQPSPEQQQQQISQGPTFEQMRGVDSRVAGNSIEPNPEMTREGITGQTQTGEEALR